MIRRSMALCAALALAGCGVELFTTTAIQSELQAEQAKALRGQVGQAAETSGRIQVERAIQTYRAEKGQSPPSLDALVPQYLPQVPTHADGTPYAYDPATGQLGGAGAASPGPTAEDQQTMHRIRQAINQYGTATGYYPGTLEALVPQYLPALPKTASGEAFVYNNQTGELRHPHAGAGMGAGMGRGRGRMSGGGGGTPMTEMMGGMGVQQELNRMNQSGANSAGNRMRQNARQQSGGRNQEIDSTMNRLGL